MSVNLNLHLTKFEAKNYGQFATVEMTDDDGAEASVFFRTPAEVDALIKAAVAARSMLLGETSEPVPQGDMPLCGEAKAGVGGVMCTRPADHAGGHKHEYSGTYWPRHDGGREDQKAAGALPHHAREAGEGICGAASDPSSYLICTAQPGHVGEHVAYGVDEDEIGRWPQTASEDLDAALTPPGYSLPAGELGWDEPLPPFHSKGGPQCAAKETPSGFICTAQPDHAGPLHVAYGADGEICHSWRLTADAPAERAR